jgi:hypothetical protein
VQVQSDIFFLDWEQPRLAEKGEEGPRVVSIWRTILAANEWAKLQVSRRTSVNFTLFWIGFFLIGIKLQVREAAGG